MSEQKAKPLRPNKTPAPPPPPRSRQALNRDDLLSLEDAEIEEVDMNQWWPGKKVFVRSMTVADRDAFEAEGLKREGKGKKLRYVPTLKDTRTRLLVRCLCDEAGALLLGPEDIEALSRKHSGAMEHLTEVARRINGLSGEEEDEEQQKDREKNSPADRSAA